MAFTLKVADLIAADTTGLLGKHETWSRVRLADVATILNGAPFDAALFSNSDGFPLVRIRDVIAGETSTFYRGRFEPAFEVRTGDLLVGMDGDFHSALWRSGPALLNQRVCRVTCDERHYEKRLLQFVLPGYLAAINANTPSVTVKHLSSKTIGEIELPLPPRAEQTRIVDKLEELLSDLDAGVAELKAAQGKLARYRQSLLKAAVEGRLTEAWRAQHGEPEESGAQLLARILRERQARWETKLSSNSTTQKNAKSSNDARNSQVIIFSSNASSLKELPHGWAWTSLGQCFHVSVGATPSRKNSEYWGGDIPWVSSGEVRFNRIVSTKEHISNAGLRNSSTRINPVGSVMLGMIGEGKTRGQAAVLDIAAANNQNCAAIWVSETDVPPEYVYYWLWSRYDETRRRSSGNNQPALNKSIVEAIPMPLPPTKELSAIVDTVETALSEIATQEAAIVHGLHQAAAQRQNILRAAFSGQLVPQDPNDEPASVLLERIRAERAAAGKAPVRRGRKPRAAAQAPA